MENTTRAQTPLTKSALHIPIILLSIIVAIAIGRSNLVEQILQFGPQAHILAALVVGVMYSSFFTVAPATVAFVQLAQAGVSPLTLALIGGIGAMIADISIYQFIKFSMMDDITSYLQRHSQGMFAKVSKMKAMRYSLILIGAIVMATPFPDEIGLALMGIAKEKWTHIAVLGFTLNAIGIYIIALIAVY